MCWTNVWRRLNDEPASAFSHSGVIFPRTHFSEKSLKAENRCGVGKNFTGSGAEIKLPDHMSVVRSDKISAFPCASSFIA